MDESTKGTGSLEQEERKQWCKDQVMIHIHLWNDAEIVDQSTEDAGSLEPTQLHRGPSGGAKEPAFAFTAGLCVAVEQKRVLSANVKRYGKPLFFKKNVSEQCVMLLYCRFARDTATCNSTEMETR